MHCFIRHIVKHHAVQPQKRTADRHHFKQSRFRLRTYSRQLSQERSYPLRAGGAPLI
jgi:hypothetical protein